MLGALRGGIGSIAVKIASTVLGLMTAVLLARSLGAQGYGIYTYVVALVAVLSIPAQLGLPNLVVRETAKAQAIARWDRIKGLWRWSTGCALGFVVVIALCVFAIAFLSAGRFSEQQLHTFYWGLWLMPFLVLGNLCGAALRGLQHVLLGQLPEQLLRPAFLLLFLLVAWILQPIDGLDSTLAMAVNVLSAILALLAGLLLLRRNALTDLRQGVRAEYRAREWLLATLPLAFTASMYLVNSYADIIVLGLFWNAEDVGIYRVAVTGATTVVFALTAVNAVVAPQLARLHGLGDHSGLQKLVTSSARMGLLFAAPVFLLILVWGGKLLEMFFGAEFVAAYPALITLGAAQLVNATIGPVGVVLNMTGHERDTARAVGISALVNIGLNLVLIPLMGITGAAAATALSVVIWNVIMRRAAHIRLGIESAAWHLHKLA